MSIGIEIKADDKALRAAFERLSKAGGDLRQPLGRIGLYVRREAQRRLRSRPNEWGPKSGRLSQSLAMRVDADAVRVGSPLVYAAVQQLGHPGIRPKRGKYLAIPVDPGIRRRGVWPRDLPRGDLKFVMRAEIRIGSHSWTGPALVRASDPPPAGKGKKKRAAKGDVMFALVKQVRIKGRPYLLFDQPAQAFALRTLESFYRRLTGGGQ